MRQTESGKVHTVRIVDQGPREEVMTVFREFPDRQRQALVETWHRALAQLPGAEQCIAWNMPSLRIDGELVLSMLGFQGHNSVFPGPGVIDALGEKLAGFTVTKGTIHFDRDWPMTTSVVKAIIAARVDEINESFPRPNGQVKEFYANGWLKETGKMKAGQMHGAWKWFRRDGTLKRSGRFKDGQQVGTWVTYDAAGEAYKVTEFRRS